jgi:23S rRNA pseudouridine1911/1915/1917 synthase
MATEGLELEVPASAEGTRLDRFLAASVGSRAQAQSLIEAGRVRVDGEVRAKRHLVRTGERIEVESGETPLAGDSAEVTFAIAYEDEHLMVVDKPTGVVVHPARGHWSGTLVQALEGRAAGGEDHHRPGIVHRLDRDTSGLLVVAKSESVHRTLKAELSARRIHREYTALVDGHVPARSGTIDAPIGRDRRDRVLVSLETDVPREARTHYELEEFLPSASLLRVSLETGRTHQIRVHFAAIDHPVCGDPTYGVAGRYGLTRQFLHATRLRFPHPVTGAEVDARSPLPDDLQDALLQARRGPD